MKTLIITLATLIAAATIFACDDTAVCPDKHHELVIATDIEIEARRGMVAMPDGSVATLLDKDSVYVAAIVKRNGEVMLSDACKMYIPYENSLSIKPTSSNELFIYCPDSWNCFVCKIDNNGKIVYARNFETRTYLPCLPLDNGGFVISNNSGSMDVYDNKGENTGFVYNMEGIDDDFECNGAFVVEDKFFFCDDKEYRIFNPDGSFVGSGKLDSISDIKYFDGYIYAISHLGKEEDDVFDDQYRITKMDVLGNQIFKIEIKTMFFLDCSVGHDNTFIVTGINKKDGNGAIYLYDNSTGSPKYGNSNDTILMKYDDCLMIPYVVAPDRYGEYDVYAVRWNYYEDEDYAEEFMDEYKEGGYKYWFGNLYIYHTDDLHKLYTE
ncbi:MAG: hypothetical protein IKP73_14560 [Bacteroidales bacterium]|nr:hypothetical protein [Bacteroidales bacterium]